MSFPNAQTKSKNAMTRKSRGWFVAFEYASPLLNALALTAFSSLLIGLVFGGALFGTKVPNGSFLNFQSYLQQLLSPFSTWQLAQGHMGLLHPILDVLSGDWFGLSPFAYFLFALLWVLAVGLLFRSMQKSWNALGYKIKLTPSRFFVGLIGLAVLPLVTLIILNWFASPFSAFVAESPWLRILFMGLAAWIFYAGIHLWLTPKQVRVFAVLVGATISTLIFAVLEPTGQWVVTNYGPFDFLTNSMVFLVWNFCLWFSLSLGFVIVMRWVEAPISILALSLGERLTLSLDVLKALSARTIKGGRDGHTVLGLKQRLSVQSKPLNTTLDFLRDQGFAKTISKRLFDLEHEWQLTAPLNKLSMSKLLKDLDGSVQSPMLSKDKRGLSALSKLESYWSDASIAEFLDWQWEDEQLQLAIAEKTPERSDQKTEVSAPKIVAAPSQISWFEPQRYLQAVQPQPKASEATTLQDVQAAIAKAETTAVSTGRATTTSEADAQPSISDIISKLSTR